MTRCVILGAGASYGASKQGALRCPLVTGILPSAQALGLFEPGFAAARHAKLRAALLAAGATPDTLPAAMLDDDQHLEVLTTFIRTHFGVEPKDFGTKLVDFERLFALTEAELLGWHGLLRAKGKRPISASPSDVLGMQIRLVLCGTLIAATGDLRCDYHDVIARWLSRGDTVISFNYDLLMDRSLLSTGEWFRDDGYGIRFHKHGSRAAVPDGVVWRDPLRTASKVPLLKPHGSLNWLYPRNSWDSVMNMSLHGPLNCVPPLYLFCLDDMYPRFDEDYPAYEWWERYEFDEDGFTFDLHSLIVPPSTSKPYRDFEPFMGPIWGSAISALLESVTELYLVGYSLREDDIRSHHMLRQAVAESDVLERIVLIAPSLETLARAKELFAPKTVEHLCDTIEQFAVKIASGAT